MNMIYLLSAPLHTLMYLFMIILCVSAAFNEDWLRWNKPVSEIVQFVSIIIGRTVCIGAAVYLIEIAIPFFKDDYLLATNQYIKLTSYPVYTYNKHKDLNEYVDLGDTTLSFLFDSGMDAGHKYVVKYLPNTQIAIYRKEISP